MLISGLKGLTSILAVEAETKVDVLISFLFLEPEMFVSMFLSCDLFSFSLFTVAVFLLGEFTLLFFHS